VIALRASCVGPALPLAASLAALACCGPNGGGEDECGPTEAVVARIVDGDTVELEGGEKIRYLMVDTPEITSGHDDCYGTEARDYNAQLVEGQQVTLRYDEECLDRYDRLLAYVELGGREVNAMLVERGYACVLYIPPNGTARRDEFEALEAEAQAERRGMWGACEEVTCAN